MLLRWDICSAAVRPVHSPEWDLIVSLAFADLKPFFIYILDEYLFDLAFIDYLIFKHT